MVKPAEKRFLWSPEPGRWYVRRKGRYHRITAAPGTEEFDRQYWAILRGQAATARTSWAKLVETYRSSDRWKGLKPRTRKDYDKAFTYIIEKNGGKDATRVTRRDALAVMDANPHRVRFGNYVASVMSVLVEHAIDLGWMKHNPVKGVRRKSVPEDRRKPHLPWTDEAVQKFRAEARPLPRLIFELGLGSVQRPADWPRVLWGDYDGDRVTVTQGKTGVRLHLPCSAALRAALDAAKPCPCDPASPILRKPNGDPMTYSSMSNIMALERKRLGLEAFDLHALRYRGVMELAFAGCDDDEIASYSGHASKEMIRKYAGEARQIMRAESARAKRGNGYGTQREHDTALDTP